MVIRTLDYGTNNPFSGVFGRPRNLAWPVDAYRIIIPASLKSEQGYLNPFERVVLGVIDAVGGLNESMLADETCIPVDLVRSVVLRLRDRGLIDSDNRIIDLQRRRWDSDAHEDVYTSALVFRELVGGEVLPFVHVLDACNPLRTKESDQKTRTLPSRYGACDRGAPSIREVIDAVTQMQGRVAEHRQPARIPTIDQVRVEREPEGYLLDCRIAIQTRDADFRIADPFGVGFSRALEGVLADRLDDDESLQTWMTNWRQSLAGPRTDDRERMSEPGPFDTPENRRRFPNLVHALTPARGSVHRSVTDIYAALEWALFYTCEAHDPSIAIRLLNTETGPLYSERVSQVAASLGFEVPPLGFRPIFKGKFDDYVSQKSEMETVLAIALIQAASNQEHPLHALAASHPDFIVRLRVLNSDRGRQAHRGRATLVSDVELDSDAFMREAVSTLLPGIRFAPEMAATPSDSQTELLLEARTSLLGAFSYQSFAKLGPETQNALIDAEKFWLVAVDGDNAREFVLNLYAALQGVLRGFLGESAPLGLAERDYTTAAGDRARKAGLGDLPTGIASVNPRRIREALDGKDLSVGASVVALLLTGDESRLTTLARSQPTFLVDVGGIQDRRGHGNEPIPMSRAGAKKLRRTAITMLTTLLDLTNED